MIIDESLTGLTMSKRQITRARILSSAWHLFAKQGYEETTTRQIARHAEVADGTVFSHFPTKLEMLREGMMAQLSELSAKALSSISPTSDIELGMTLVEEYYRFYFANVALSKALLKEVIWDLDYYQSFNQALFDSVSLTPELKNKTPLIIDCYFMTLITHLSKPTPCVEQALAELKDKFQQLIN